MQNISVNIFMTLIKMIFHLMVVTFNTKVCLTAQQGGNKSFRRIDLLDELNTEKRELQR